MTNDQRDGVAVGHDRFDERAATAIAYVLFAAMVVVVLAFIHQYAVDSIYYDQWWDIRLLDHWYAGTLSFSDLWAPHWENRILFPNLVVLLLTRWVHFNTIVEQYLNAALLLASTVLIVWSHRRRSGRVNLLWYVPVAALLVSFVQYGDLLWGFQLAWYLVYFSLALSLFLLDRQRLTWLVLGAAVVVGIVGSYSSLQGLLIWPVGLLLMYQRNRSRSMALTWLGSGIVVVALYFYRLNFSSGGSTGYALRHPIDAARYFFVAIGDLLGIGVPPNPDVGTYLLMAVGVITFLIAMWLVIEYGRRKDETSGLPLGVALTTYGLLFAFLETTGRASQGLSVANSPRYTTFNLLIPAGCILTLLSVWSRSTEEQGSFRGAIVSARTPLRVVTVALIVVVGMQGLVGTDTGLANAAGFQQEQVINANVTVNESTADPSYIDQQLFPKCICLSFEATLPHLIEVLRKHHLSMFSTGDAAAYAKASLPPPSARTSTRIVLPKAGAIVHGNIFAIVVVKSPEYLVTRLDLVLSGRRYHNFRVAAGVRTKWAWLSAWDTGDVPNGHYRLNSTVYAANRKLAESPPLTIDVANPS